MSGGIDSSVTAYKLQKMGYNVIGVTFVMFDNSDGLDYNDAVNDAKIIASQLNIKHYTIDLRKEFKNQIVKYFVNSYISGLTPNPCALCNRTIKFKNIIDFADKIGVDKISTGHYALIKNKNGRYFVSQASDSWKDQTYFLWKLPQEYLKRIILPLSSYTKDQVREIAREQGFVNLLHKRESYDVCFVEGENYRHYLDNYLQKQNIQIPKGKIISEEGIELGEHSGITHYTVGQRRGLGIAADAPLYVKQIDKQNNTIIVAKREKMNRNVIRINNINLQKYTELDAEKSYLVRVRFRDKGQNAKIRLLEDGTAEVVFEKPVFGIAPGQSAVFYEGNDLVGGGEIIN